VRAGDDGTFQLAIEGELDSLTVAALRPVVEDLVIQQPRRVEVDLSKLRIVDSAGVGTLVYLYKRVRARGGQVVITGLQSQPLAIFRLLRLEHVMVQAPAAGA
jgi:anti-sigma B factor antagonist